jgi:hypothetical protein
MEKKQINPVMPKPEKPEPGKPVRSHEQELFSQNIKRNCKKYGVRFTAHYEDEVVCHNCK